MPNLWTKLTSWFKPQPKSKSKKTNLLGKKVKFIKSEAGKKDKLTLEQRLKRCEQLIEQLTKEEKAC